MSSLFPQGVSMTPKKAIEIAESLGCKVSKAHNSSFLTIESPAVSKPLSLNPRMPRLGAKSLVWFRILEQATRRREEPEAVQGELPGMDVGAEVQELPPEVHPSPPGPAVVLSGDIEGGATVLFMLENPSIRRTYRVVMTEIDPQTALEMLTRNENNRKVKDLHVARLASDMRNGKWRSTHEGIAFNRQGVLVDGQHRLTALFEAGVTLVMPVWLGLDESATIAIDSGITRSITDASKYAGFPQSYNYWSCLRAYLGHYEDGRFIYDRSLTKNDLIEQAKIHHDAVRFAEQNCRGYARGLRRAGFMAAFARAYHYADHDVLREAVRSFALDIPCETPRYEPMKRLRDYALRTASVLKDRDTAGDYGRAISALSAVFEERKLNVLKQTSYDPWPVPKSLKRASDGNDK